MLHSYRSASRLVLSAGAVLCGLLMASAAPAVVITIVNPGTPTRLITNTGVVLLNDSAVGNASVALNTGTYTLFTDDQSDGGNCGTFSVAADGTVTTSAPGMNGGAGTLSFNTTSLTVQRGTYDSTYYWPFISGALGGDITRKVPLGMSNMQLGWGNWILNTATNTFMVNTDSVGNINVTSPNAGIYPFHVSGTTVTFNPVTVSFVGNGSGWGLDFLGNGNAGVASRTYNLMPGNWTFYTGPNRAGGFTGTYSSGGLLSIPTDPRDVAPLTYTNSAGGVVTVFFPEPASLGLISPIVAIALPRRRRACTSRRI